MCELTLTSSYCFFFGGARKHEVQLDPRQEKLAPVVEILLPARLVHVGLEDAGLVLGVVFPVVLAVIRAGLELGDKFLPHEADLTDLLLEEGLVVRYDQELERA